jgi:hypothetical protein
MTTWKADRGARLVLLGVTLVVLLAVGVVRHTSGGPRAEVVHESPHARGWKTIEYDGVRVDVPAAWERWDTGSCEFTFERWGPPGLPACAPDAAGVAFYDDATFDPARGPGVGRAETPGPGTPDWAGYVRAGDVAVYASDDDRAVVEGVLGSAR